MASPTRLTTSARHSDRTMPSSASSTPTASCRRCRRPSACCGRCPEQKSLVYFASGLRLNGVDNQAQLRATINAAIRANVSIFPVDARGLVATRAARRRARASPGGVGMFTGRTRGDADGRLPALAGHALRARQRHRRQGAVRLQRSLARHRAGRRRDHQLLHPRLLQHPHGAATESSAACGSRSPAACPPS